MADQWELFRTRIGDDSVVIVFNDGVAAELDDYDLPNLLRVQIGYKTADADGFPAESEYEDLFAVEDLLELGITRAGGCYVGRVSAQGCRTFLFYCDGIAEVARGLAREIADGHGYEVGIKIEADPEKCLYWDMLYPTPAERQTIKDLKVIDELMQHGEDLDMPRPVEHFTYFANPNQADLFVVWAKRKGYRVSRTSDPNDEVPYHAVVLAHETTAAPDVISAHTVELSTHAARLGGEYDGWETPLLSALAKAD